MRDLASYEPNNNIYRNFMRWLERQKWRHVLPAPAETLGPAAIRSSPMRSLQQPRIEVLLRDRKKRKADQIYVGSWHIMLPHETRGPYTSSRNTSTSLGPAQVQYYLPLFEKKIPEGFLWRTRRTSSSMKAWILLGITFQHVCYS